MPIRYPEILDLAATGQRFTWTERETMLYALGVGLGADPMDKRELAFVYENNLRALPTQTTVTAWGSGPPIGSMINFLLVVHGEQSVTMHRPMPTDGAVTADSRVIGAYDKGPGKGAVIYNETTLTLENGDKLATLVGSTFARGDGGFGGPSEGAPEPHRTPDRAPDRTVEIVTRPDQALIYRLSGDRNPLHSDP